MHLFGEPVHPEQVSLIYWFTVEPNNPAIFRYTVPDHEANREYLAGLVADITSRDPAQSWELTPDETLCKPSEEAISMAKRLNTILQKSIEKQLPMTAF